MNDRTLSGQFAEPAFGQEAAERSAGYVPMPDPKKKDDGGKEFATVREAARALTAERNEAREETIREVYTDAEGNEAPRNETITIERAADDMRESRQARAEAIQAQADAKLLAELGISMDEKTPAATKEAAEEKP